MSRQPRKRNSDVTRAQILDAARELFVADGYDTVTVRKVAGRVGISHGTIYLYFRDKDDLLVQVSEEQFARLLDVLRRLPRTRKPLDRLADALRELARFGIANPHEYFLMMGMHAAIVERRTRRDWGPMAERVSNFINDLVAETVGAVVQDRTAAGLLAWNLTASVTGLIAFAHGDGMSCEEAANAIERHVELLLRGLPAAGVAYPTQLPGSSASA